ncbi:hypothetical protein BJ166DRAFT_337529 [Pestalotiopsis sp. NC0098]|nr:hypothetical protein BJ166DRAFT_337529 [Pestalotiopsis sp. NC0098]
MQPMSLASSPLDTFLHHTSNSLCDAIRFRQSLCIDGDLIFLQTSLYSTFVLFLFYHLRCWQRQIIELLHNLTNPQLSQKKKKNVDLSLFRTDGRRANLVPGGPRRDPPLDPDDPVAAGAPLGLRLVRGAAPGARRLCLCRGHGLGLLRRRHAPGDAVPVQGRLLPGAGPAARGARRVPGGVPGRVRGARGPGVAVRGGRPPRGPRRVVRRRPAGQAPRRAVDRAPAHGRAGESGSQRARLRDGALGPRTPAGCEERRAVAAKGREPRHGHVLQSQGGRREYRCRQDNGAQVEEEGERCRD